MLSRLRLDCKQCIFVFRKLAEQIFKHDQTFKAFVMKIRKGGTPRFSGTVLENAIKNALRELGYDENELMWDEALFEETVAESELPSDSIWTNVASRPILTESPAVTRKAIADSLPSGQASHQKSETSQPSSTLYGESPFMPMELPSRDETYPRQSAHQKVNVAGCRGFVLTSPKHALGLPKILTTYDPKDQTTRIWEALRATSAAPAFFEEMQFGTPKISYLGGSIGFNNPCAEVAYAAKAVWKGRPIGIIVSVGTGLRSMPSVKKIASWLPFGLGTGLSLVSALADMATSTVRVDNEMKRMCSGSDTKYYRFDVNRGLADIISLEQWMKEDEMATLTEQYMRDGQQLHRAREFGEIMAKFSTPPPKLQISATQFRLGIDGRGLVDDTFQLMQVDLNSGEGGLTVDEDGQLKKIYPVPEDLDHDGRREEADVYQCTKADNVCLRALKTGIPPGRYRVQFVVAFHDSVHTAPCDLVFSAGKPFDAATFTSHFVDVKKTPDVATVLLHPDAVRVRVGSRRYAEYQGKGWQEMEGDVDVCVGLDGALGFLVSKEFKDGDFVDGWSFGGVRLEPVLGRKFIVGR